MKGVDPATTDRIFERSFTTKPSGMGMAIIDSHRGRFRALPRVPEFRLFAEGEEEP